ncbi:hypothetical protein PZT57_26190 [Pseudomonas aeruginosa]|uniref:hypothetical protein n=1 Tax=Pseudomonas aeruginosa TaxID=287 RepID=UPI002156092D|nr:hypothetical protein [Pseudomonas aeruginosa]MBW6123104.1 Abi family protein [Pseudomonas aeruginosa]MEA8592138.1 hypothetical protein [Pseudomonas aeruginosa]HCF9660097.1 Abi family protein [Pseudomonas aeruginosa]
MNWNELERHFSTARLGRFSVARNGDKTRAASDYTHNILLAEAMMPMLNILEISLRNGIHRSLTAKYGRADWWAAWAQDPAYAWQTREVQSAIGKLTRRKEQQHPDKIVAELTFGFWVSLFNSQYQLSLWKNLRLVFGQCPKPTRQRHNISTALNQIRDLRNRVFHHEPLLWLSPDLQTQHAVGVQILGWIDPALTNWLGQRDRLPGHWQGWLAS